MTTMNCSSCSIVRTIIPRLNHNILNIRAQKIQLKSSHSLHNQNDNDDYDDSDDDDDDYDASSSTGQDRLSRKEISRCEKVFSEYDTQDTMMLPW